MILLKMTILLSQRMWRRWDYNILRKYYFSSFALLFYLLDSVCLCPDCFWLFGKPHCVLWDQWARCYYRPCWSLYVGQRHWHDSCDQGRWPWTVSTVCSESLHSSPYIENNGKGKEIAYGLKLKRHTTKCFSCAFFVV